MSAMTDWNVPVAAQPRQQDLAFDLDAALAAVVGLRASVPADAFTAGTLGVERSGNGVVIRKDGLVLTIGYLITEAEEVWLTLADGAVVPGHVIGYDQTTGLGLVQALARIDVPALSFGRSSATQLGERVVVAGAGGRQRSVAARIVARQEFAGYWEYVLDDAIFTAPSHPLWGGTALIGPSGDLLGIGSLQLEGMRDGVNTPLNMIVPIDLLPPILDDMLTLGRPDRPPRPWLGIFASEIEDRIIILGLAPRGPASRADLRAGDVILGVDGEPVDDLAVFFRRIWALGDAGVEVPLRIWRDGDTFDMRVNSGDRNRFLKAPKIH